VHYAQAQFITHAVKAPMMCPVRLYGRKIVDLPVDCKDCKAILTIGPDVTRWMLDASDAT
jgi:hypothetical protein